MNAVQEKQESKVLDLSGLMCPLPVVMTSEHMKRLKDGEVLTVVSTDPGFELDIKNWCAQTGNELLSVKKENNKVVVEIKKKPFSVEPSLWYWIKFHALGVKLHLRQILMDLNPFIEKPDHFITFTAISEGTRAEKFLKGKAKLIPVPNEIDPRCGVVLAVAGYQKAKGIYEELLKKGFGVEAIYKKEGKSYRRVYP
ncbi:Sulfurtransferase TusA [bacterium HR13]|nr:Sulfurtransferase TusA [bacterium HR13]